MNDQIIKKTYEPTISDQIFKVKLLDETDIEKLKQSCEFILSNFKDVPMYRPLAIKIFGVLNDKDFPTSDLKNCQCKSEAEVHANELIRELHEFQIQKVHIDKAEYLLTTIMKNKYEKLKETDEIAAKEVEFDMIEQQIIISRKKFELKQLEKKIKYRIMEISEWKEISELLLKAPDFKNKSYNTLMLDLFTNDCNNKLADPKLSEDKKLFVEHQLKILNTVKTQLPI